MADVLPSCIGMEGLLYQLCSGFVQANKSHRESPIELCWSKFKNFLGSYQPRTSEQLDRVIPKREG